MIDPLFQKDIGFLIRLIMRNPKIVEQFSQEMKDKGDIRAGVRIGDYLQLPGIDRKRTMSFLNSLPNVTSEKFLLLIPEVQSYEFNANGDIERAKREIKANPFNYIAIASQFPENYELARLAVEAHPFLFWVDGKKVNRNSK